jgi:hypothetical protein
MDKTAIAPRESLSSGSFPVSRPPLIAPPGSVSRVVWRLYNALRRAAFPQPLLASGSKELDEIRQFAATPSDIDEHLERMFTETLLLRPKLIVELGVRGGASTFVFERAAALCSATLVSVDIDDCSAVSHYARWHFVRGDDVAFAAHFQDFCRGRNIALLSISCSSTPATITNTPSGRSSLGSLSCHPQRKSCFTIQTWGSHRAAEMVAFNGLGTIIGV